MITLEYYFFISYGITKNSFPLMANIVVNQSSIDFDLVRWTRFLSVLEGTTAAIISWQRVRREQFEAYNSYCRGLAGTKPTKVQRRLHLSLISTQEEPK